MAKKKGEILPENVNRLVFITEIVRHSNPSIVKCQLTKGYDVFESHGAAPSVPEAEDIAISRVKELANMK